MDWKLLGIVAAVGSAGCMDINILHSGIQGSGKAATEHRTVPKFSAIDAKGALDVEVLLGQPVSIVVSGDDNLIKLVETTVEGDTLVVSTTKNVSPKTDLKVKITVPNLNTFELHGAGDVKIAGLKQDNFELDLYGAGDVIASGSVGTLKASLYGAGDMDLFGLKAENATANLRGAGDLKLYASNRLEANISGAGDVSYKGHPKTLVKSASGVGEITSAD